MSETLTREVLEKYHNSSFVETGTYHGGGIELALKLAFDDVRSVEFLQNRFDLVRQKYLHEPNWQGQEDILVAYVEKE